MDGMFSSLLTPVLNAIYPCSIEEIRSSIQKEKRIIDTLEPLMNQHRLVIDYTAIKKDIEFALSENRNIYYSLMYQLTHITKEKDSIVHDDRLDALALGIQYWNEYGILKQNSDDALDLYKKKQLEDELKRRANIFRSNSLGKTSKSRVSTARLKAFS